MAAPKRMEELETLLVGVVAEFGVELDSVIEAKDMGFPVVRVIVDAPEGQEGIDADVLADVSRKVSVILDDNDPFDSEYMLEVSTPGAERELTKPRHWCKEIGHLIRVKMRDGEKFEGRLLEADEDGAVLDCDGTSTKIQYENVKKARPRVELTSGE